MPTKKPTRYDVKVDSWQERDRLGIWVTDTRTDKTIAEWWDDVAREMFEGGFFKSGVPQHSWEKPAPAFVDSVLDYLEDTGVLAKESQSSSQAPEASASNLHWRTVAELKQSCSQRGLPTDGGKEDLIRRLEKAKLIWKDVF